MAHFAKVGDDGIVERVTVVSNTVTDPETTGTDDESLGQAFLTEHFGAGTYVQCSYNDNIRGHFPGVGDTYDSVNDIFHKPQPFPSWTLNTDTGYWEPPLARPTVTSLGLDLSPTVEGETAEFVDARWDEAAYQADNTTGWVVLTMDEYTGDLEDEPIL
tara:strand:- start:1 stop:477 length:477 start_codon:yes stop_codon:yes gene_type:complete